MLPRAQLFEFNDLDWVGPDLRDSLVESLSRLLRWGRILENLVPPFRSFLEDCGTREVLDLCAGAGGPATILAAEYRRAGLEPPRFVLTDLYPRLAAWQKLAEREPGVIDLHPEPVDATRIPEALGQGRARAVINAFHHFPPELAQQILRDAVDAGAPIFVSEAFDRNPLRFLTMAPTGVAALLANPVLSDEPSLRKIVYTWLTPIALGVSTWDGFVSTLRVYTEAELRGMVAGFGDGYRWTWGTYDYTPLGRGTFFHGVPRRPTRDAARSRPRT